MITCVIIEDQAPAQRILQKYIKDYGKLDLVEVFSDPITALEFLKKKEVDLIFLDIHLPKLSGMDFLKVIDQKPFFILTTAFHQYAVESYEFDVVDYLLKPISYERFLKAVNKLERLMNQQEQTDDSILVKLGYDYVSIQISSIVYIQSDGDYTNIVCDTNNYFVGQPLKYWKEHLPASIFSQVHRSFIVNIKKVEKLSSSSLFMKDKEIPIGRKFKGDVKEKLMM